MDSSASPYPPPALVIGTTSPLDSVYEVHGHLVERQLTRLRLRDRGVPEATREDARQSGILALLTAAKKFDGSAGVKFETVAVRRIRDAVLDEKIGKRRERELKLAELDPTLKSHDRDLEKVEIKVAIEDFMATLSPLQRAITRAVYWDDKTQAEVARERGVSRAAVNAVLDRVHAAGRIALAEMRPASQEATAAA